MWMPFVSLPKLHKVVFVLGVGEARAITATAIGGTDRALWRQVASCQVTRYEISDFHVSSAKESFLFGAP